MVLEGLKSAVDVFFRPPEEPHPLQCLRSVSPLPSPEHTQQVGPAPGLRVTPFSLPGEWEGRTGCTRQALPGVAASLKVLASARGRVPVLEAVES